MDHTKFLKSILETPQALQVLAGLTPDVIEQFIWLLKEAHIWGYYQDFPVYNSEV